MSACNVKVDSNGKLLKWITPKIPVQNTYVDVWLIILPSIVTVVFTISNIRSSAAPASTYAVDLNTIVLQPNECT